MGKIRKNHAVLALETQGAGNLRAIVKNFSKVLDEIWEDYNGEVEKDNHPNNHPVAVLFAAQVSYLTSPYVLDNGDVNYEGAYRICEEETMKERE